MDIFKKEANVLIIGDVMLDKYYMGDTHRISPEAPVPIVKINDSRNIAGGAANVALNVSVLNINTKLLGICGDDKNADILEELLTNANVNCELQRVSDKPTITKTRIMSRHQQLIRLDEEQEFSENELVEFSRSCVSKVEGNNVVVLSDYAKGAIAYPQDVIEKCNELKIPVIIDPKGRNYSKYKGATMLTPNMSEFEDVVGKCSSESEIVLKAFDLIEELELKALLLTRSESGVTLFEVNKTPVYFAAHASDVFDVTGAGDTVIATLATCLAADKNLEESVEIANIAAGIVVLKMGTATVSIGEIRDVINNNCAQQKLGVVTENELSELFKLAHDSGEKIVMTNGCFDILHPGHIGYLGEAKKLGDRLVVAVNSDESVRRLKGELRPINNLANRMEVLAGLSSVDWVIPFFDDTPEKLINKFKPDVLVKGGDYSPENIVGAQSVWESGGEVKTLSFSVGCSTTNIIQKIKEV